MIQKLIDLFKELFGFKTKPTKKEQNTKTYTAKQNKNNYSAKKLLTYTEQKYYEAIKKAVTGDYLLYPQINLATIVERTEQHKYQNELYRNIDFAIFDKSYNPILLIEINDKTHKDKKRIARDIKVKEICQKANLPLITFWTEYGINQEYINKRIAEYIK